MLPELSSSQNNEKVESKARGHLIVVEGLDRSGKTTQCEMLCEDIKGVDKDVKYIKFPSTTSPLPRLFILTAVQIGQPLQGRLSIHICKERLS